MRVITFSRVFPAKHPRKGEPTYFIEKVWKYFLEKSSPVFPYWMNKHELKIDIRNCYDFDPKHHTIRAGNRWKVGDKFSPRIWSGQPYRSKQIQFAPDMEIKKIWDITITTEDDDGENDWSFFNINGKHHTAYSEEYASLELKALAKNDGLSLNDFYNWFSLERTQKQRLEKEPKIFNGQIICWNESINY